MPKWCSNSIIAAGLLEQAAKKLNWTASIECQSSVLPVDVLSQEVIDGADAIIIAANTEVDTARFVGKKYIQALFRNVLQIRKRG